VVGIFLTGTPSSGALVPRIPRDITPPR
jgi:hypothetical protein